MGNKPGERLLLRPDWEGHAKVYINVPHGRKSFLAWLFKTKAQDSLVQTRRKLKAKGQDAIGGLFLHLDLARYTSY